MRLARWCAAAMVLLLVVVGAVFARYGGAAIIGADDHGYVAQGARMAVDGRVSFTPESPIQYVGRHWLRDTSGVYVSRYAPGVGITVAAVQRTLGSDASVAINAVLSLLTLVGVSWLAAQLLGAPWGLAAAILLASSPLFLGQGMLMGSHPLVACLAIWGTVALRAWHARGGVALLLLGAGAMGLISCVRSSDVVMALGVAVLVVWAASRREREWRDVLLAALAGAVALVPLLAYNQVVFGHPLRTAYALTGEDAGFALSNVARNARHYAWYLGRDAGPIPLALAAVGALGLLRRPAGRPMALAMLSSVGALLLVYLPFFHVPRAQPALAARFLLPALPLVAVLAAAGLHALLAQRSRALALTIGVGLLAGQVAWTWRGTRDMARDYRERKARAAAVVRLARAHVPEGNVVFSSEEVFLTNLDVQRRWRVADRLVSLDSVDNAFLDGVTDTRGRAKQQGKRAVQTAPFEGLDAQARDSLFLAMAKRWAPSGSPWFVGPARGLALPTSPLAEARHFTVVARDSLASRTRGASEALIVARWNPVGDAARDTVSGAATLRPASSRNRQDRSSLPQH